MKVSMGSFRSRARESMWKEGQTRKSLSNRLYRTKVNYYASVTYRIKTVKKLSNEALVALYDDLERYALRLENEPVQKICLQGLFTP